MIDDQGVKQSVCATHQAFFRQAREFEAQFKNRNNRLPTQAEFNQAALEWIP
jgi:hypothetical protein